jgi:hypothetical protein
LTQSPTGFAVRLQLSRSCPWGLTDPDEVSAVPKEPVNGPGEIMRTLGHILLAPQERHGLHAVGSHVQMDRPVGIAEGFLHKPDISRMVFD